jgi:hypothetical protein
MANAPVPAWGARQVQPPATERTEELDGANDDDPAGMS